MNERTRSFRGTHRRKPAAPPALVWLQGCLLLLGAVLLSGCGAGALAGAAAALASGGGGGGGSGAEGAQQPTGPTGPSDYPPAPSGPFVEIAANGEIVDMVLSSDGSRAYCSDSKAKEIVEIDLKNRTLARRIQLDFQPGRIDLHPSGQLLYVVDSTPGNPSVREINLESELERTFAMPEGVVDVAVDTTRLFVSLASSGLLIKQLPDGPITTVTGYSVLYNAVLLLDRVKQTLYVLGNIPYTLGRFDVSGAVPVLGAVSWKEPMDSTHLALSPDGQALLVQKNLGLREISSYDFTLTFGDYSLPGGPLGPGIFDTVLAKVWAARFTESGWKMYQFDRKTFQPERIIDISSIAGTKAMGPNLLRITPDSSRLLFTYRIGSPASQDRILLIDTSAAEPLPPAPSGTDTPGLFQIQHVTDLEATKAKDRVTGEIHYRLYAADHHANQVLVIDAATDSLLSVLDVGAKPRQLAVRPGGDLLAVTLDGSNSVAVIDPTAGAVKTLPLGATLYDVAFGPEGSLYVLAQGVSDRELRIIDPGTMTEKKKVVVHGTRMLVGYLAKKLFTWFEDGATYSRYDIPSGFLLEASATLSDTGKKMVLSPEGKSFLSGSMHEHSTETFKNIGTFSHPFPSEYPPTLYSREGAYVYGFGTTPEKQLLAYSHEDRKMLWVGPVPFEPLETMSASVASPVGDKIYVATYITGELGTTPGHIRTLPLPSVQAKGTGLEAKFFDLPADSSAIGAAVASGFSGYSPGTFSLLAAKTMQADLVSTQFPHVVFSPLTSPETGDFLYWGPNNNPEPTSTGGVGGDDILVLPPGGQDSFGAQFTGFIAILFPGTYTFRVGTEGWLKLRIGAEDVIPTSGPFISNTVTEGTVTFQAAGYYLLELNYGHVASWATLVLEGKGPGLPGGIIPKHFFQFTTPSPTDP